MLSDRIIKTTFIVSLTVHFSLLAIPQFNLNLSKTPRYEEIIAQIEIEKVPILPKPTQEYKQIEPVSELQAEEVVMEEPSKELIEEKVEAINPTQEVMLRYQDIVKQKIEKEKEYPAEARRQGIEGVVYIRFTILSDGQTDEIKIIKSSGYKLLDDSAVTTIRKSNPFPPLPEELNIPCVQIEVNLVYTLK